MKGGGGTHPASRRRGVPGHLARREVWTFLGLRGVEVEEEAETISREVRTTTTTTSRRRRQQRPDLRPIIWQPARVGGGMFMLNALVV